MTNLSKTEIREIVKQRINERWQKPWDEERKGRWYCRIQSKVGEIGAAGRKSNIQVEIRSNRAV